MPRRNNVVHRTATWNIEDVNMLHPRPPRAIAVSALRRLLPLAMASSSSSSSSSASAPRAAVCVVGNEVLSGKTQDTNTHFIAKLLFRRGVDLARAVVIPDELETIAETVKQLSELVGPDGYVFTTGGIGPTHDDITYEGVARAFGRGVELHQPTLDALTNALVLHGRLPTDVNDDMKRMAILPAGCKVLSTGSWVPLAVVHNVYVLPGIPRLVREMLEYNEEQFKGVPIHRVIIHTLTWEGELASAIKAIQTAHPRVAIGSYVNLTGDKTGTRDESYNTRLTVDGRDADEVERVTQEIMAATNGFRFQENKL